VSWHHHQYRDRHRHGFRSSRVSFEEVLKFPGDIYGIAFNVDEKEIGCRSAWRLLASAAGDEVERRGHVVDVPVGEGLIGRIINPMGRPLDGKGPVDSHMRLPIERPRLHHGSRARLGAATDGIKVIDALIPVGHGQRELILGDRQTGKDRRLPSIRYSISADKNVLCGIAPSGNAHPAWPK